MKNNEAVKRELLESALWKLVQEQSFYGALLQEVTIKYSDRVPTACIYFNKKQGNFNIDINFNYFSNLKLLQRSAVLFHEILHFSHKHLIRFGTYNKDTAMLQNIAADIAINQLIDNLPEGCVKVDQFKASNGAKFPEMRTYEEYFKLLQNNSSSKYGGDEKDGKLGKPVKAGKGTNDEVLKDYKPFDQHDWEELTEAEREDMLKEAEKVCKRTIEKSQFGYSTVPDAIQDLIKEIEVSLSKINYKSILAMAIKKSISVNDKARTWNRPSKRFGTYAPGTKAATTPQLSIFVDTSGSISHQEINEFLTFINGLLKVGAKKCELGFWHTELYKIIPFKMNVQITDKDTETGGTDPNTVLNYINKNRPNLSVILTDGFFSNDFNKIRSLPKELVWVISKNGEVNHPYKSTIGKTVKLS